MVFAIPLVLLGVALVVLLAVPQGTPLLGLDHASFARAVFAVALVVWLALAGARRAGAAGLARVLSGAAVPKQTGFSSTCFGKPARLLRP